MSGRLLMRELSHNIVFPYDHNASLDANLQTVNEKLNDMEEYREELQEAEYGGRMRR